jgi:hypothetical protein
VKRVPSSIEQLCSYFEKHVKKEGLIAIESCADKAFEDPQIYISTIWKVYEKYQQILEKSLASDSVFYKSLDKVSNG